MIYKKHQPLMQRIKSLLPENKVSQMGSDLAIINPGSKHIDLNYCQAMDELTELENYLQELVLSKELTNL